MLLAIESSCDECSASVVERGTPYVRVRSNVIHSQIDLHQKFGGVVPEVASRNHLEMISPIIDEAVLKADISFKDLNAIAVTSHPGLVGALLVGVSTAKALAYSLQLPLIAVNHLEGHLHSLFIDGQVNCQIQSEHLPLLICLVSGGHTNLYLIQNLPPQKLNYKLLSSSRDDAAGEAFDKTAKLLGLQYPGGIHIDKNSKDGNPGAFAFPRPLTSNKDRNNLDFSFSGLKTAVLNTLAENKKTTDHPSGKLLSDYCASIQEAIVDTLMVKINLAIRKYKPKGLAIVGGVSANSRLREKLAAEIKQPVFFPDLRYCTDNAAMIGACGLFALERKEFLTGKDMLRLGAHSSDI